MNKNDDIKQNIIDFFNQYYKSVWENENSCFITIKPIMVITIQDIAARFNLSLNEFQNLRSNKEFDDLVQSFINTNLVHFYSTNKFRDGIVDYARVWSKTPDDSWQTSHLEQFYDHAKWTTKFSTIASVNHDLDTDQDDNYFQIEKLE